MELIAAIRALEALKKPCRVQLHTDSAYVRDGITRWIHGWRQNGWRTADRKPVKNAELWQNWSRPPPAPGRMALGQGPQRPSRERPRRCLGLRRSRRPARAPPRYSQRTNLRRRRTNSFAGVDDQGTGQIGSMRDLFAEQQRRGELRCGRRRLDPEAALPGAPEEARTTARSRRPEAGRARRCEPCPAPFDRFDRPIDHLAKRSMAMATSISSGAASHGSLAISSCGLSQIELSPSPLK